MSLAPLKFQENFFLFGLRAHEVDALRGHYQPQTYIDADPDVQAVMGLLSAGHFNALEPGIFDMIIDALKSPHDPWMTLADFAAYRDAQQRVALAWQDQTKWTRMSILNTAASGFFSTDRTMHEYNRDIWKLEAY